MAGAAPVKPPPKEPTSFKPGSPEKIRLMRRRLRAGFAITHHDDVRKFPKPPKVQTQFVKFSALVGAAIENSLHRGFSEEAGGR